MLPVGIVIFAIYLYFSGFWDVLKVILTANPLYMLVAFAIDTFCIILFAEAWVLLVNSGKRKLSFKEGFEIILASIFGDLVVPTASFSGEVLRIGLTSKRGNLPASEVSATVLLHRLLHGITFSLALGIGIIAVLITEALTLAALEAFIFVGDDCGLYRPSGPTNTAADSLSVEKLYQEIAQLESRKQLWQMRQLSSHVHMKLTLSPVHEVTTDNVLALFRGTDAVLNKQLVIVAAHYDGPGRQPDGTLLQSANDGLSGIATMLEILRLWTARGFQPRRTILFAAWTGGEWEHSGAHEYLTAQAPYSVLRTVAVINLNELGRGGEQLLVHGNAKLVDLVLRSAESTGVSAKEGKIKQHPYQIAFAAPMVTVGWDNNAIPPTQDTADRISASKLGEAGQVINLALITLSREYEY